MNYLKQEIHIILLSIDNSRETVHAPTPPPPHQTVLMRSGTANTNGLKNEGFSNGQTSQDLRKKCNLPLGLEEIETGQR